MRRRAFVVLGKEKPRSNFGIGTEAYPEVCKRYELGVVRLSCRVTIDVLRTFSVDWIANSPNDGGLGVL